MQNVRALAATALATVIRDGRPFDGQTAALDPRDRALFRELCYGTLRQYFLLEQILRPRLKKPLGKSENDVQALLLIGLYQLIFLRTPDHAALNATVDGCMALQKKWAKGLVNGVLRNFLREWEADGRPLPPKLLKASEAAQAAHPDWLYGRLKKDWPNDWQQLVDYNNGAAPMILRVDLAQNSREEYQQLLADADISTQASELCGSALQLEKPLDPTGLPGFDQAQSSVQDSGAQLAAELLNAQASHRVLDACAAPGGKALHIAQHSKPAALLALDISNERLEQVRENLARDKSAISADNLQIKAGDAANPPSWWDGQHFDRILLDAPCSGSGVIAHHPDIKLLRRKSDIAELAATQLQLLQALWPLLAKDGELLYCTCSVLREENEAVIAAFLADDTTASLLPIDASWGVECKVGRQLLPKNGGNDGFFYARLRKH